MPIKPKGLPAFDRKVLLETLRAGAKINWTVAV
jgi:hypothetical protein